MKLNIVRAWKDEFYRQSLSDEQVDMLPANPVGEMELTDTSLQFIYGSDGGGGGYGSGGGGGSAPRVSPGVGESYGHEATGIAASSASHVSNGNFHSLAVRCNETAFSLTMVHGFNLLSPVNAFCITDND